MQVRRAVFPAAGLGTRFLPATKAQPKEMLPLVDTPIIQYVVQEAVASGLDHITLVTGRSKRAIEDHFDAAFELEYYLHKRGKTEELAQIEAISELASLAYVRQKEPLGLGHAILCRARGRPRTVWSLSWPMTSLFLLCRVCANF
jgi:UTP--glucose-1-phosphate uridylyltransferase